LLLLGGEVWRRVAIQGFEQGILSLAIKSFIRRIKIGRGNSFLKRAIAKQAI
jgi:hypothetical protein